MYKEALFGLNKLDKERLRIMQEADSRRTSRTANELMGITDYTTLQRRLKTLSRMSRLRHMLGAGALSAAVGAYQTSKHGGKPDDVRTAAVISALLGGPILGTISAGVSKGMGNIVATNKGATKEQLQQEYRDIMDRSVFANKGIGALTRFQHQLGDYIDDNMPKDVDVQSYSK